MKKTLKKFYAVYHIHMADSEDISISFRKLQILTTKDTEQEAFDFIKRRNPDNGYFQFCIMPVYEFCEHD